MYHIRVEWIKIRFKNIIEYCAERNLKFMDINKELLSLILFSKEPCLLIKDLMSQVGVRKLTEYQKKRLKPQEEQATSSNQPPKIMDVSKE